MIDENLRQKNEISQQFSMNDPNVDAMLKKMQVKTNNFVD